jgi:hypothetical protein
VKWKLASVRLETVLISAQDRCTFCAVCTTGTEMFLTALVGPPSDAGQMEACFGRFSDNVMHGLRRTCNTLGNCFGHTDGTPR